MKIPFIRKKQVIETFGTCIIIVGDRLELFDIDSEKDGTISCDNLVLPIVEGREFFSSSGERFVVYNLSLEAKIEAEAIQKIRESEVIKGLFETPEPKRFMDMMPMIILGLVALMSIIIRG